MIIYGSSVSPYARKVLVFAEEKGIAFENRRIGVHSDDPEFLETSPFAKIPALRDGDFTLCDSSAIIHYLDAVQPDPPLIPIEPRARAKAIWFDEFADTILFGAIQPMFWNRVVQPLLMGKPGNEAAALEAEQKAVPKALAYLESVAPTGEYLLEDRLTLADIAVASPCVNLMHLMGPIDAAHYPRTAAYLDRLFARPSFARWIEVESGFLQKLRARAAG
jgi:glutathione S-transferase